MSGGHFDYDQYKILNMAEAIESIIDRNDSEELDEYGDRIGHGYSRETIQVFYAAVANLNYAYTYAQRIDWLLSGDDDEKTFHKRLKEDIDKISRVGLL